MQVEVVADSTGVIRSSVSDAAVELGLSILLVVLGAALAYLPGFPGVTLVPDLVLLLPASSPS